MIFQTIWIGTQFAENSRTLDRFLTVNTNLKVVNVFFCFYSILFLDGLRWTSNEMILGIIS